MTYRERREARAERLRGWAATRNTDATQTLDGIRERYRGDHAFNTQPGHIPERARVNAREDHAFESMQKAESMDSKAASIESATDRAIYMDDSDAKERLEEKIATLETERDRRKAVNMESRKHKGSKEEFVAWLETTAEPRDRAEFLALISMYQGSIRWAKYDLTNIGGTITKERKRLAILQNPQPQRSRVILCRYTGTCGECGATISEGQQAIHVERGIIACYPNC